MSYLSSLFGLDGKTALITGATRGIGQSMALALAGAGADIVLVQRSKENLETHDKIKALGRACDIAVCDLASEKEVKGLTAFITGKEGLNKSIDILVNCGGIQRRTPAENFPDADWDEVMQVNLHTVWILSRDIGKHMLSTRGGINGQEKPATANPNGRGKIINVASLCSFQGGITVPAYTSAKHAVLGLTRALSNEWASKDINVNSLAPGYIATDMNEALIANPTRARQILERIPAGRWGSPKDFEGIVVFLASPASDYVCGECVTVDGGWMAR